MGRPVPCRDRTGAPIFLSPSRHAHKSALSCALSPLSPFECQVRIWHLAVVPSALRTATKCVAACARQHEGCPFRPHMPAVPRIPAYVHSTLRVSAPCLTRPFPSVLWSCSTIVSGPLADLFPLEFMYGLLLLNRHLAVRTSYPRHGRRRSRRLLDRQVRICASPRAFCVLPLCRALLRPQPFGIASPLFPFLACIIRAQSFLTCPLADVPTVAFSPSPHG